MPGLNVALFSNSIVMGGMESHVLTLAHGLQGQPWPGGEVRVFVILPEAAELDPLDQSLHQAGVRTFRLTLIGGQPGAERLQKMRRLAAILKDEKVEVFHQHRTGPFHGKWAVLAARLAGTPVAIATEHNAPDQQSRQGQRLLNGAADRLLDRLIVVSEENRQRQLRLAGRSERLLTVVHNGIDLQRFQGADPQAGSRLRRALDLPQAAQVIGFVGRLHPVKGAADFLQALAALEVRHPDLYGLVVGSGEQRDELRRQAQALGVAQRVRFTGFRSDIPELLRAMDIFILPSHDEPFGLVVAEAMAAGLPVVATRVGGVPEIIEHEQTGLLVSPRCPDEIASAVDGLLQAPEQAARLAEAGRQHAGQCFSREVMVEKTLAVYLEACARRSRTGVKDYREGRLA